jgi:hypothetical protein
MGGDVVEGCFGRHLSIKVGGAGVHPLSGLRSPTSGLLTTAIHPKTVLAPPQLHLSGGTHLTEAGKWRFSDCRPLPAHGELHEFRVFHLCQDVIHMDFGQPAGVLASSWLWWHE